MNKELFASMRKQTKPGEEVRAALAEKLAAPQKKRIPVGRYVAVAACAAVIIAAVPVFRVFQNRYEWWVLVSGSFHRDAVVEPLEPHSYVLAGPSSLTEDTAVRENSTAGSSDEDQDMTPGGALIGAAPDQSEAIMAYQNLMAQFEADYGPGRYPDWYGGAYIDEHAVLIVNIVKGCEEGGKELERRIQDWAGSNRVGFGSTELSLNELRALQDKVVAALDSLGLVDWGCGVNEETGQVELTLPKITREALLRLAALDPEGTAILVAVGEVIIREGLAEEPVQVAPSVSQSTQPGGASDAPNTPVGNTPGMIADEDGVIAWEPQG